MAWTMGDHCGQRWTALPVSFVFVIWCWFRWNLAQTLISLKCWLISWASPFLILVGTSFCLLHSPPQQMTLPSQLPSWILSVSLSRPSHYVSIIQARSLFFSPLRPLPFVPSTFRTFFATTYLYSYFNPRCFYDILRFILFRPSHRFRIPTPSFILYAFLFLTPRICKPTLCIRPLLRILFP